MRRIEFSKMLVTSGFNFEGYRIVKYSEYILGDNAISVNRGFDTWGSGNVVQKLMESLVVI